MTRDNESPGVNIVFLPGLGEMPVVIQATIRNFAENLCELLGDVDICISGPGIREADEFGEGTSPTRSNIRIDADQNPATSGADLHFHIEGKTRSKEILKPGLLQKKLQRIVTTILESPRPTILVGHSAGGLIAMKVCAMVDTQLGEDTELSERIPVVGTLATPHRRPLEPLGDWFAGKYFGNMTKPDGSEVEKPLRNAIKWLLMSSLIAPLVRALHKIPNEVPTKALSATQAGDTHIVGAGITQIPAATEHIYLDGDHSKGLTDPGENRKLLAALMRCLIIPTSQTNA